MLCSIASKFSESRYCREFSTVVSETTPRTTVTSIQATNQNAEKRRAWATKRGLMSVDRSLRYVRIYWYN